MSLRDLKVGSADTLARTSGHLHKNLSEGLEHLLVEICCAEKVFNMRYGTF